VIWCVPLVAPGRADADLTPAEKGERQWYADRSLELLRQAVKLGLRNAQAIRADADFNPLRGRDDFEQLIRMIEERDKGGK
jgi:hypothetical protein